MRLATLLPLVVAFAVVAALGACRKFNDKSADKSTPMPRASTSGSGTSTGSASDTGAAPPSATGPIKGAASVPVFTAADGTPRGVWRSPCNYGACAGLAATAATTSNASRPSASCGPATMTFYAFGDGRVDRYLATFDQAGCDLAGKSKDDFKLQGSATFAVATAVNADAGTAVDLTWTEAGVARAEFTLVAVDAKGMLRFGDELDFASDPRHDGKTAATRPLKIGNYEVYSFDTTGVLTTPSKTP